MHAVEQRNEVPVLDQLLGLFLYLLLHFTDVPCSFSDPFSDLADSF